MERHQTDDLSTTTSNHILPSHKQATTYYHHTSNHHTSYLRTNNYMTRVNSFALVRLFTTGKQLYIHYNYRVRDTHFAIVAHKDFSFIYKVSTPCT